MSPPLLGATAIAAFLLPKRPARRRNVRPTKLDVFRVAQAQGTSTRRRDRVPVRGRPWRRVPALSSLPGAPPAHEGGQPRGRAKTLQVHTDRSDEVTRRHGVAPWKAHQRLKLRPHLTAQRIERWGNRGDLTAQDIDPRQGAGQARGMVRGPLPLQGHFELRDLAAQAPTCPHRPLLWASFTAKQRRQHPTGADATHVRHPTGELDGGVVKNLVDAVFDVRARRPQGHPRTGQVASGAHRRRWPTTWLAQPRGQECRQPGGIVFGRLFPGTLAHLAAGGQLHRHRVAQHRLHWLPGPPRALQGPHRALLLVSPGATGQKRSGGRGIRAHLRGDLPLVASPTHARRPLRRLHIATATHRRHPGHRAPLRAAG